uniref:ADAM metallopeptidase domain 10 n=1 Tax=Rhinolophus ferrumequinum TaxID=59479 RepID=A0A671F4M4_RHIFE
MVLLRVLILLLSWAAGLGVPTMGLHSKETPIKSSPNS